MTLLDEAPRPLRPARPADSSGAPPALLAEGLVKSYGPVRAVRGVDLRLEVGEVVALLGRNGAGKSTTTEMVLGIVEPDAGTVEVLGADPVAAVRAGRVGAMLQGGALLGEARVRDVLRLVHGLHRHPRPIGEVVERADLGGVLRTRTDRLSGGEAQRLRYALALLPDPELLVLDEPTVGMDVEARRSFWHSTAELVACGRTVVFATHYLDEADASADRVVLMADGVVVADGTPAELKGMVGERWVALDEGALAIDRAAALPGVTRVEQTAARMVLRTRDRDATLRALLATCPDAREVQTGSASLEDAFLELTAPRSRAATEVAA